MGARGKKRRRADGSVATMRGSDDFNLPPAPPPPPVDPALLHRALAIQHSHISVLLPTQDADLLSLSVWDELSSALLALVRDQDEYEALTERLDALMTHIDHDPSIVREEPDGSMWIDPDTIQRFARDVV